MPAYTYTCPACGHTTELTCTIQMLRSLPPITCSCGTPMRRVWEAPALAPDRRTEGKA